MKTILDEESGKSMEVKFQQSMEKKSIQDSSLQKQKQYRDKKYLAWIRSLNCCATGRPAEVAHHVIACGFGGCMSGKLGDNYAIPLTQEMHQLLHHDPKKWEAVYGEQRMHLDSIIEFARREGMLKGFDAWSVNL